MQAMPSPWVKASASFGFTMVRVIACILPVVGPIVIVLLCAGDKSTQTRDIKTAKALAAQLEH
jgi:hypothetical protein